MVGLFTKNNNFLTTILKLEWNFNATNAQIFYDGEFSVGIRGVIVTQIYNIY